MKRHARLRQRKPMERGRPLERTAWRRKGNVVTGPWRGSRRVGQKSIERRRSGGKAAQGRASLSVAGIAKLRAMLMVRARGKCERCGAWQFLQMEHALPRSRGGADSWSNCWITCSTCHRLKEAPYRRVRLLVEPVGDGTFWMRTVHGSKMVYDVITGPTLIGRQPTPEEIEVLAAIA